MKYDVYGIGNPLVDINTNITDRDLEYLGLNKGIMHLIDLEKRNRLFEFLKGKKVERYAAGSCANTIMGVSKLGGRAVFWGKIGEDAEGVFYNKAIGEAGVISDVKSESGLTGTSTILVTPDSERTMNTYLGNCRKYSVRDVDAEKLSGSRIFYTTGYMWDSDSQKQAALHAFEIAKKKGIKIVFGLGDPFLVKRNRDDFLNIIKEYADVVIANEEEARFLTGKDTEAGIRELKKICSSVIITLGKNGSVAADSKKTHHMAAFRATVVDTTGAGDMYAAGVLYGLSRNMELRDCAQLGNLMASWIVTQVGVRF